MDLVNMDNEELIYQARYIRFDMLSNAQRLYMEQRLDSLGYIIEYGCCGSNTLRMQNERQSHIPKNE